MWGMRSDPRARHEVVQPLAAGVHYRQLAEALPPPDLGLENLRVPPEPHDSRPVAAALIAPAHPPNRGTPPLDALDAHAARSSSASRSGVLRPRGRDVTSTGRPADERGGMRLRATHARASSLGT